MFDSTSRRIEKRRTAGHADACFAAVSLGAGIACASGCADGASPTRVDLVADLGAVLVPPTGATVEHVFEVMNPSSSEPMQLELVEKTCTCLVDSVPNEVVPLGEAGRVTLSSTIGVFKRPYQWTAQYRTGLKTVPGVYLTLKAHGYPRVVIEPTQFPRYELLANEEQRVRLVVTSFRPSTEDEAPVTALVEEVTAGLVILERTDDTEAHMMSCTLVCDLVLRCSEDAAEGAPPAGFVERVVASQGSAHSCEVAIHWFPSKAIKAAPSLVWVKRTAGRQAKARFVVEAQEPFSVHAIESSDGAAIARAVLQGPATRHVIECEFGADEPDAATDRTHGRRIVKGTFRLRTDHPTQNDIKVPWFVFSPGGVPK